ncbi:MAG: AI-2E family transporter [Dehalococcoidia bacterium]
MDEGSVEEGPAEDARARGDRSVSPIYISRRARNWLIAGTVAAVLFILWTVPTVLTIVVLGGALALVLSFPVRFMQRVMGRRIAIVNTLLSVVALLVLAFVFLLPPLISQMTELVEELPNIVERADHQLRDTLDHLEREGVLPEDYSDDVIRDIQEGVLSRASTVVEGAVTGVVGTFTSALGLIVTGFGILFVAVYLLFDARKLRERSITMAPARYHDDLEELWDNFGDSLSRYLAGLMVVSAVQGTLASVGLLLLGVPYALLLGVWIAMTSVIPYLGSWLGAIPALILASLESPRTALLTLLLYFTIQTVEGNLLTPRIQGEAVQVHPVFVLLTVVAAGSIMGLMGVLLAVPLLAMARVLFDFLRARLRVRDEARAEAAT